MNHSVMIKGTKSGIIVVLDQDLEFDVLLQQVAEKFKESSKFLGNTTIAITFEGRELNTEQEKRMVEVISENSELKIACVIEQDPQKEELFRKSLDDRLMELSTNTGQFYKGNLRSGQVLDAETSIIIIGDVNVGARVMSKGNIIVLGTLRGNAFAGASGNPNAFVVALHMEPVQIKIADLIARAPDKPVKKMREKQAKIAFIENGNIYIEPLSRDVLNDIMLWRIFFI